ncbi:hypothetical protein CEXT_660261 [Caerostris extrusa]|uniref:Uncharacterized protein n=1 Tax=Caerostris extrusa TaxID=172846 RepID=A0AAV4XQ01_CAEEX|nr:hypothetical protein CEXT_660261 [Caerostris extrusa]
MLIVKVKKLTDLKENCRLYQLLDFGQLDAAYKRPTHFTLEKYRSRTDSRHFMDPVYKIEHIQENTCRFRRRLQEKENKNLLLRNGPGLFLHCISNNSSRANLQ